MNPTSASKLAVQLIHLLRSHWGLIVVLGVFTLFSLIGLDYCLPEGCDADEGMFIGQAMYMSGQNMEPQNYAHPATFQGMLLALVINIFRLDELGKIVLYGRTLTVVFAVMSVGLVYFLAWGISGLRRVGLVASIIYAFNPLITFYTKQFRSDIFLTFFILLTVALYLSYLKNKRVGFLFASSLAAGLAVTNKYSGLLVLTPLVLHCLIEAFRERKLLIRKFLMVFAGWFWGLFLGAPYLLFNIDRVVRRIGFESRSRHPGADGLGFLGNQAWYLDRYFNIMGNGIFVLSILGLLYVSWKYRRFWEGNYRAKGTMGILAFCITFFFSLSSLGLHWTRWMIPLIPILSILAATGFYLLIQKFGLNRGFMYVLLFLLLTVPFLRSVTTVYAHHVGDTRMLHKEWIRKDNLPVGTKIRYGAYTGQFPNGGQTLNGKALEQYKSEGVDYLSVSSAIYDRYFEDPARYSGQVMFYRKLFQEKLIVEYKPAVLPKAFQRDNQNQRDHEFLLSFIRNPSAHFGYKGPHIQVYKITPGACLVNSQL